MGYFPSLIAWSVLECWWNSALRSQCLHYYPDRRCHLDHILPMETKCTCRRCMGADLARWYPWSRINGFGNAHTGSNTFFLYKIIEHKNVSKRHSVVCVIWPCTLWWSLSVVTANSFRAVGKKLNFRIVPTSQWSRTVMLWRHMLLPAHQVWTYLD